MAAYNSTTNCYHNEDFKERKSESDYQTIFLGDSSLSPYFIFIYFKQALQFHALLIYYYVELL